MTVPSQGTAEAARSPRRSILVRFGVQVTIQMDAQPVALAGAGSPSDLAAGGTPVIRVADLRKTYQMGDNVVHALRGVSLTVYSGEFVAVMGPSGSGKSTFMNVIGCLDRPMSGSYELDGAEVTSLSATDLADLRNRKLGFIFQGYNLLPRMDAL